MNNWKIFKLTKSTKFNFRCGEFSSAQRCSVLIFVSTGIKANLSS